jgi:peptide/nickel transport system permease protein
VSTPELAVRRALRRPTLAKRRTPVIAGTIVLVLIVAVALVPTPYAPNAQLSDGLSEQGLPLAPSLDHPLGTDTLGRDELSRVVAGGRISLLVGTLGSLFATTIGAAIGLTAGYFRRWVGTILMRFTDVMMAFPYLLLAIALQAVIGPGVSNLLLVIAAVTWVNAARVMNGLALSESGRDYIAALEVFGAKNSRIILRHLLPNLAAPVIVLFTTGVGYTILLEATLSYLGLGVQPPTATWGNMIREGQAYFQSAPWLVIAPGAAIVLSVVAFNLVGEQIADLRRTT